MTRNEEQAVLAKGVWCDSYNFYLKYHGRPADHGLLGRGHGRLREDYEEIWRCYGVRQIDAGSVQPFGGGNPMNDPKKISVGLLHLPEGDR